MKKKVLSTLLTAMVLSTTVASVPAVSAQAAVVEDVVVTDDVTDVEAEDEVTVGEEIAVTAVPTTNGDYTLSGSLVKATDTTAASMANAALDSNLSLNLKDGVYTVTATFSGLTVAGTTGYLDSLKSYATGYTKDEYGNPVGTTQDATVLEYQTDASGTQYPKTVSFVINHEALVDGLAPLQVRIPIMEAMTGQDSTQYMYLKLDWDTVAASTSTVNPVSLKNGYYNVTGNLMKATDSSAASGSAGAFETTYEVKVDSGKYTLYSDLKKVSDSMGFITDLAYFEASDFSGTAVPMTVVSYQAEDSQYPDVVSCPIITSALTDGLIPIQMYIPAMAAMVPDPSLATQKAYIKLEWNTAVYTKALETVTTPTPTATPTPSATLKVNQTAKVGKYTYKVTAVGSTPKVTVTKTTVASGKATIPSTVKISGKSCKVTAIAGSVFKNKKITAVSLPSSVTTIGNNAFAGCKKLKSVTIPKNVTKIGKNAFKGDTALKTVTVKAVKLSSVGKNAFKPIHKKAVVKFSGLSSKQKKAVRKVIKNSGLAKTVTLK